MKKIMIICAGLLFLAPTLTKAQALLDKMDRAADKADHANRTADRTKSTGDKILGLFVKKKNSSSIEKTTVKLTGVDFSALKVINDKLQSAREIESIKMKYHVTGSSLVLQHTCSASDLLKTLQKAAPNVFSEKNIDSMDDGEISVKLK